MKLRVSKRVLLVGTSVLCTLGLASIGVAVAKAPPLKTGLKVYVIPKNLGNSYFTTADSVKSGGACAAAKLLKEKCTETSGATDVPADQIPAIESAAVKGANALIVSATDPTALCPTLKAAAKHGITVVTYDSDAPTCRQVYVEAALPSAIGTSEVDILAKEINDTGQIAILSAAQTAPNQNIWIGYMNTELKKFPNISLVATVYGNDVPTTATQVAQGLLQQYPNLKGIISPTTVGILAAAQVVDAANDIGKVIVTGLGTPDAMKQYVLNGTCPEFELWDPAHIGSIAMYAAVNLASKRITDKKGQSFTAGALGKFTIGANGVILAGPPYVFDKANVGSFNF